MTGIRLKSIVKVPADIQGGNGITVEHSGGQVIISLDELDFPTFPLPFTIGEMFYASDVSTLEAVPPNTTAILKVLSQTGDGVTGGAPIWETVGLVEDPTKVSFEDVQALTTAQQAVARTNICAAPFDAMAYNGMQLNGAFEVSQELGTTGSNLNLAYIADNWQLVYGSSGMNIFANIGNVGFPGFQSSMFYTVTVAQASLLTGDSCSFQQAIEGWRIAWLKWGTSSASPITISFYASHNRAGTYTVAVRNLAGTRSYLATYVYASGVEYHTVSIPGCQDGAWEQASLTGMFVNFTWAAGATHIGGSANAWISGTFIAAPGQVNAIAATTDSSRITGVTILPGTEAPLSAQLSLIQRRYPDELVACQRYWQKLTSLHGVGYAAAGYFAASSLVFPASMRATPTGAITSVAYNLNCSALALDNLGPNSGRLIVSITALGAYNFNAAATLSARI